MSETNPAAAPLKPKSSAKVKVYKVDGQEVPANMQPGLHSLLEGFSSAAAKLKAFAKAKDLQGAVEQIVEDVLPSLEQAFEGFIAKAGALENWNNVLDERLEDVEAGNELAIEPEEGSEMTAGYDAAISFISSLDMASLSPEDQGRAKDALEKCKRGRQLVGEYVEAYVEGEDDDEEDEA